MIFHDGLAHNTVLAIHQDKQGYIWFGTFEGLSRFDGYRFVNYDVTDGLGHVMVNDISEDRHGRLWVATNGGGVARRVETGEQVAGRPTRQRFISFSVGASAGSNNVNRILFDARGDLWCATDHGVYRAHPDGDSVEFTAVIRDGKANALLEDRRGRFWFGVDNELIEVVGREMVNRGRVGISPFDLITDIIEGRQHKLLVSSFAGLFEFTPADEGTEGMRRWMILKQLPTGRVHALLEDPTGTLWLGADGGLIKYHPGEPLRYTNAQGLSAGIVRTLASDRDGNVWVGTEGGGASKVSGMALVSYTTADGLPSAAVAQVLEDREGHTWALMAANYSLAEINTVHPRLRSQLDYPQLDAASTAIVTAKTGTWGWMPQSRPFVSVRLAKPVWQSRCGRIIDLTSLGLSKASPSSFLFYEDATEHLWFSKREGRVAEGDGRIYRADLSQPGPLHVESLSAEFSWESASQRLMISDGAGGLWLGKQGMFGRMWQSRFVRVTPTAGLPETDPRCFFLDSRGWLWIGMRYGGVSMTQEPGSEHPHFVNYSTPQGLSSGGVWSIAEDNSGRLYFGTDKGLVNDVLMCAWPMAMFFLTRRRVRPRAAAFRGGAI